MMTHSARTYTVVAMQSDDMITAVGTPQSLDVRRRGYLKGVLTFSLLSGDLCVAALLPITHTTYLGFP